MKYSNEASIFDRSGTYQAETNSRGKLKGWDENETLTEGDQIQQPVQEPTYRKRKSTSEYVRQRFGVVEEIVEESPLQDNEVNIEPIATLLRRRRKSTVTIIRDLLGL